MSTDPPSEIPTSDTSPAQLEENPSPEAMEDYNPQGSPQISPDSAPAKSKCSPKQRKGQTASHMDVDFFDPAGVRNLNRTISRTSIKAAGEGAEQIATVTSEETLIGAPGQFDLEKTLKVIVRKRDAAHIRTREIGVLFDGLRVTGLGSSAAFIDTVGSTLNPLTIFRKIQLLRNPPLRNILSGFEGVVRPGEMLLVLGRPGSGCTTLLKVLANHRGEYHSVEGDVYYDSFTPAQIYKHYRGDVQYCPEDDYHFPTVTVKQTLDFAAKTRVPHARIEESKGTYVNKMTEILSTIFGLSHVQNTPVGDASIRGVSGGEKKRVSIAEALATRSRLQSWDKFGRALRIATDIDHQTTIVSIYQAGETLYELFDKVCLLYEGRMAYFGPASKARQYFIDLGYQPANRQTTPDFLVAVTDPNGRIPQPGFGPMPRTADDFAQAFLTSDVAKDNRKDMDAYRDAFVGVPERAKAYRQSAKAEHARHMPTKSPYTISIPMQAKAVMRRRLQVLWGNKAATLFLLFSFIFQGVIVGTVFVNIPVATSAYFSRGGVLFFVFDDTDEAFSALLFAALSSMAEIPALFKQRPIVGRHAKAAMYHPFVEALAMTIVDLPITFVTSAIFGILLYFIVHLQRTVEQFFIFYLFLFCMSVTMRAWFRAVAAAFKAEATAQALAGILLLAMVIYTGYTIPKTSMIGALRWISYINPLRYGFESIMANEFHTLNGTCSDLVPHGPGYEGISLDNQVCSTVGAVRGQDFVNGNTFIKLSFDYSYSHVWMNFGIVMAFMSGFIIALLIFTEINTSVSGESVMVLFKRGTKTHAALQDAEPVDEEKSTPSSQRPLVLYVEECLKMCGLEAYADASVGSLNIEFRKRTTIGVELAAKPKLLLFLDEPTSGLDSQSAWAIMKFLRSLADHGQAILCTFVLGFTLKTPSLTMPDLEFINRLRNFSKITLSVQVFDRLLLLRKGGQTVYFGDLGHNATTLIHYFERNGSRPCEPSENPAEFMLDVIGAGATASTDVNWHDIWKKSPEVVGTQEELERIHSEGRSRPPVAEAFHSEFATSWMHQLRELLIRNAHGFWRNPTYILAKLVLDIFGGLFIGFTFFKAKNSQQGTQNQLFAVYMATILSAPLSNQIQVPYLNTRKIYEIRERPSRMFSWTALVTSQFLAEIPWNILGSSLFFLCWYWTVAFDTSRAGYTYLMLGVLFPLYYTSFAMTVASMAPSAEIAALLFSVLFSFVLTFNGVLQPYRLLGWWKWMYGSSLLPFNTNLNHNPSDTSPSFVLQLNSLLLTLPPVKRVKASSRLTSPMLEAT
ncbi:hypothetical protein H0H92_008768 [Tricholoma furcatifolium]|nr:hypothetical protein H0H92_008768 [Tricholoma furcatifolium]